MLGSSTVPGGERLCCGCVMCLQAAGVCQAGQREQQQPLHAIAQADSVWWVLGAWNCVYVQGSVAMATSSMSRPALTTSCVVVSGEQHPIGLFGQQAWGFAEMEVPIPR